MINTTKTRTANSVTVHNFKK